MSHLALIEDEPPLNQQYTQALENAGYKVTSFLNRDEAEIGLAAESFDAWVLDLNLDNVPTAGIGLIGWAKGKGIKVPILVVSGVDTDPHGHISMELGAWDFVSKPVDDRSLVFKVNQLLNACVQPAPQLPTVPNLTLDPLNPGLVRWKGNKIKFPITAWKILVKLVMTPNNSVTYEKLFQCVNSGNNKANLRQHITTLRSHFESCDPKFDHIKVKTSIGYIWEE